MKINICYLGDCLDVLPTLPDNSVDSIVTDPPYELGFMGKSWDNSGIAYSVPMWKECLRVLKPGGHLLSFGGTRTYHRMAVAIEDAGFEVRDMIEWCYGSGFPKSLNIGKAVDKLQGNERELIGTGKSGSAETHTRAMNSITKDGKDVFGGEYKIDKGTSEWEGWGTALKPAHEPICMARKPLAEKTVAENVLKYGTGGINIDESRVGTEERYNAPAGNKAGGNSLNMSEVGMPQDVDGTTAIGRFPANLIHDNSEEVRECFPDTKSSKGSFKAGDYEEHETSTNFTRGDFEGRGDSGNASRFFKSIIYQAKVSKSERNKGCEGLEKKKFTAGNYSQSQVCKTCDKTYNGTNDHSKCSGEVYYREMKSKKTANNHPTVKPIALMEYLIKMITPKGGVVLDPFAGSGSTLVAARDNGFKYIGIEMTEEYIPIIKARTGCEIIKPERYFAKGVSEVLPELEEKIDEYEKDFKDRGEHIKKISKMIQQDTCECGGKIKKTASGRCCEWCLKDY
jgi:DNA modification methylase